ncbi:MAG: undecaprenyl-phosphate glucose phosphotransferase [Cycloclasticus sp.]|nr:undecaprenyl-phosphate glucose phosphotransferase [Cycloclasticus sp.]
MVYLSLYVLSIYAGNIQWVPNYSLLGLVASLVFIFTAESSRLYQSWRGVAFSMLLQRVLLVWFVCAICLMIIGYLTKVTGEFSRVLLTSWFLLVPVLLLLWRSVFKVILNHFRSQGFNSRQVALVGANNLSSLVIRHIKATPSLGMYIEGLYDDRSEDRGDSIDLIVGRSDDLVNKAKEGKIDIVYITLPMLAEVRIKQLIDELADTTASVYILPDIYTYQLFNGSWSDLAGHPMVSVFETPFNGADAFVKRAQDIVLSTIILTVISPVLLAISIAVKTTSIGPIIFKQRRYGVAGDDISVWKFRSMTCEDNGAEVTQAIKGDCRITPLGSFLRRTSLDELPQFINVLRGDMSIVGPRPHAVAHNELYRKKIRGYMMRHAVKPGITGWAQINGWRGETDTLDKMEGRIDCDHWYISNWSNWLDIKIIFLTIFKGFTSKNAY